MAGFISRGFGGRRRIPEAYADRLPPGQYVERGFPVLTAGITPRIGVDDWELRIDGMVAEPRTWTAEEFRALPSEDVRTDLHCVTKWSKFDATFRGVSLDVLLDAVEPLGPFAMAYAHGGYSTNVPVEDLSGGQAWIVTGYDGEPLPRAHGGPVRLLVPHLYLWKSAKWVAGLRIMDRDEPGFWEANGYHHRGDPWKEERYWSD